MTAPDLIEPVCGWRAWRVVATRSGVRLWSIIYDEPWEPREAFVASCRARGSPHDAPAAGCGCGVYATRSADAAATYLVGRNDVAVLHRVVGIVSLWGRAFAGPSGWRAAIAYPKQLWIPSSPAAADVADALGDYGVPVAVLSAATAREVARSPALTRRP